MGVLIGIGADCPIEGMGASGGSGDSGFGGKACGAAADREEPAEPLADGLAGAMPFDAGALDTGVFDTGVLDAGVNGRDTTSCRGRFVGRGMMSGGGPSVLSCRETRH